MWEKWIFKRERHGNKDLLSFVGAGEGDTKDESSLSCPICFEGIIQTRRCDTIAEGLGSLRGGNHCEFVCAIGQPEVSQPGLGGCVAGFTTGGSPSCKNFLHGYKFVDPSVALQFSHPWVISSSYVPSSWDAKGRVRVQGVENKMESLSSSGCLFPNMNPHLQPVM